MNQQHRHTSHEHEHEFEAAPGLPAPLPAGERLLWQGAPDWRLLARHAFHVRKLAGYFGLILALRAALHWSSGDSLLQALGSTLIPGALAAVAIGLASLMAWLASRTTVYTVTDRRVVMRVGVVLSVTFNLPFSRIDAAAMHALGGSGGDIALTVDGSTRIAYLHLWPHARPWRVARTQPMLRCLPDAAAVARVLVQAWTEARAEMPLVVSAPDRLAPVSAMPTQAPAFSPMITAPPAAVPVRRGDLQPLSAMN
jgi:hypothetical protein